MKGSTIISLGCDPHWDYSVLLPITCLLWRDLVGHQPYVALIGDEAEWQADAAASVALRALRHHGFDLRFVAKFGDYKSANLAQSIRQHVPADHAIDGAAWVMMADADMWPIQRDFFHQHVGRSERLVSYFADGDCWLGKEFFLKCWAENVPSQSLPTPYFTMRASEWRTLYGYASSDIGAALRATFDAYQRPRVAAPGPGWSASTITWYFDQYYMTERACRQEWFPEEAFLIPGAGYRRGHLLGWTDAPASWESPSGNVLPAWLDLHIRKGCYINRRWEALLPPIGVCLPQHAEWARTYFEEAVGGKA